MVSYPIFITCSCSITCPIFLGGMRHGEVPLIIDSDSSLKNPLPSCLDLARKVVECAPVQNQAAAQKLLQKMTQPAHKQYQRGQRYKGRLDQEDKPVFTLDEWERRKAGTSIRVETRDHSHDEDLARKLQSQFDLEDEVQMDPHPDAAVDLKMSMFSFEKEDSGAYGRTGTRGRGRGRGRSRGRGRGCGRGGF